jgi:hypothetical protein
MIEFSLTLDDGSSFPLNTSAVSASLKNSTTIGDITISKSSNIVSRSYGDGSVKVGTSRIGMKQVLIILQFAFSDDNSAREYLNSLFGALRRAEYLVDETNELRTRIDFADQSIAWDDGSYLRLGEASINLNQLVPFWETNEEQELVVSVSAGVPTPAVIDNEGCTETPFVVTVEVEEQATAVSFVEIQNIEKGRSAFLTVPDFGLEGFLLLSIDSEEGSCLLENVTVETEIDAQNTFESGTGYFNLFQGVNTLEVRCAVAADFTFRYRPRYFV